MRISADIVSFLLDEGVRACANCQKEHGIVPEPGTSLGMCKRHALAYWEETIAAMGSSPGLLRAIEDTKSKPEEYFSPDLGPISECGCSSTNRVPRFQRGGCR